DAHHGHAALLQFISNRERAVAADHDQGVESELVKILDAPVGIVSRTGAGGQRIRERVAAIRGAQNRPAQPKNASHLARRQRSGPFGKDQAVEAVFETDALDPGIGGGLHHRADNSVEAGRVTATRENTYATY